ncbi:putative Uncharacterized aminotransferase [Glarea lozoyensis 74030]|uniref:Putative Uncharacterized aminotransferase n=1 Tax=Glarea lozoyensis (strain ATCC 74030 / MF5533) TaxID=1104152 RepID=H0ELC5_GLAL7|nr:putative Uncharacterized aminotransferase [Glarea lozoyensis 74030]
MMDNISFVSTPNLYRGIQDGETTAKYVERLAKELDDEFKRVGPQEVAAFIAETFTGSSTGCLGAPFGYFPAVKAICEKHGSLLYFLVRLALYFLATLRYAFYKT